MIIANVIQDAFSPLIKLFEGLLVAIHNAISGTVHGGVAWGLAIIGMTIVVRIVTLPLTIKQFRSIAKMQQHQPEMKAIQERYKDDKQRQQQELMKFYKENNVNPFASCLPLVLQLPVFVSLFYMLRTDLKSHICGAALKAAGKITATAIQNTPCDKVAHGSAKFFFIPDITTKATGAVLVVLLVLYVGTQMITSLFSTMSADRNQRMMALALPLVFTFVVIGFPAGLLVYWITTNIATLGQQVIIRRGVTKPVVAVVSDDIPEVQPPPPPRKRKKKRSGRRR